MRIRVTFTPWLLRPQGESPRYPEDRKLCGPQRRFKRLNLFSWAKTNPGIFAEKSELTRHSLLREIRRKTNVVRRTRKTPVTFYEVLCKRKTSPARKPILAFSQKRLS